MPHAGSALPAIGVPNGEDGDSILTKINAGYRTQDKGKILITALDTCPAYLLINLKQVQVSFTQVGGCAAKLRIDSTTGGTSVLTLRLLLTQL